jgi:beta-fructofuranosidase
MPRSVFFRPDRGWVGDVIPVEVGDELWLYYLHERREEPKPGTAWGLVRTSDFVQFTDMGVGFHAGNAADADFNAYTGSVVLDGDKSHLFYTGQNPSAVSRDGVMPRQIVMHAISSDGLGTWEKRPDLALPAPARYEDSDWRDPFVFRESPEEPWRMLVATRHGSGPDRRRGVIAQYVSHDLMSWSAVEPFWDPHRYTMLECPDVFRWGDWWYLVYSEFSDSFVTRYRMARSVDGPWSVPERDTVDGRAFYAAKSAALGNRRFFVGWIATKEGESDAGAWEWAGTMSTLEARQEADGTLSFRLPAEVVDSFALPYTVTLTDTVARDGLSLTQQATAFDVADSYRAVVSEQTMPAQFYAHVTIDIAPGTTECGLLIRSSADGDESYVLRIEPRRHRVVFDRWPRKRTGSMQWEISGDQPHAVELERPCPLQPGRHEVELLVEDSICVAVIDHSVVLSARMYDRPAGRLGLFTGEGSATFTDLRVRTRD